MKKIISIHSQKGGTGKTSLAISLAIQSASVGKKPVIIDADLSGTTMRDILHFPDGVKFNSSIVDYFQEPKAKPLNYLNVAQIQDQSTSSVHNIPIVLGNDSADHSRVMSLVYKETHTQFLKHKLEKLINAVMVESEPQHDVVIIDNSPGSWGLSKAVLEIVNATALTINPHAKYDGYPLMVSSPDLNDVISCMRIRSNDHESTYIQVINRSPDDQVDSVVKIIGQHLEGKADALPKDEGYRTYATQIGGAGYISWVGRDDREFSPYVAHVKSFKPIGNISTLAKNFLGIS